MEKDTQKTVLRIIQDFCFKSGAIVLIEEFVSSVAPRIIAAIDHNRLTLTELKRIIKRRGDFFIANELNVEYFAKELLKKLKYETSFLDIGSFQATLIEFKRKMENGNFRGFPKDEVSEDTLRCTLDVYLREETFCEARSGAGNCDIVIPSERTIIETKLWKGIEYYNSGFPELDDYLSKSNYSEGYYIIFDYNKTPNEIIIKCGELFKVHYNGRIINIIFIRMNAERPSKIYRRSKA